MMKYRWWAAVAVLSALFTTRAHAQQSADLTGRVLLDTANVGVSRVTVTLLPGARRAGTDAAGRFRFGNVPAGDYVLRIASAGYTASDVRVRISSGSNNTVELRVARITRLAPVSVRDSRVNFATRAGNLGSRTDVPPAELPFAVHGESAADGE